MTSSDDSSFKLDGAGGAAAESGSVSGCAVLETVGFADRAIVGLLESGCVGVAVADLSVCVVAAGVGVGEPPNASSSIIIVPCYRRCTSS